MQRVKENPSYARTASGSIVNTDASSYQAFIAKNKSQKELQAKVDSLEAKLDLILRKLGIENGTN
jgi:hypothetical protein